MAAVSSPGHPFPQNGQSLIHDIIGAVLRQLPDVNIIFTEARNDVDQNYDISLTLRDGTKEPASIFSLKDKDPEALIAELNSKIENHLINRERSRIVKFDSGAMLENNTDVSIVADGGRLLIDGKVAVIEREGNYMPLPTAEINTYTLLRATKKADILKLSDEYDQERTDDKEGFLFHLGQVHNDPEIGQCLILYRNRGQIPA